MKHILIISAAIVPMLYTAAACATSVVAPHTYANVITTNNVAAIQHSIMRTAIQTFQNSVAPTMNQQHKIHTKQSVASYGRAPMYGTMPMYGEYNDDGSAQTYGRSGGDTYALPAFKNAWGTWQHFDDNVKFNGYDRLESGYDLITFGLDGNENQMSFGTSHWGVYAGYVGGAQENTHINIDENGGYIGIYNGYRVGGLAISASVNGGALYSDATHEFGTDEFTNLWGGVAADAHYNIALDNTFTLQPGLYAGYTWVKSANYTSASHHEIKNDNLGNFEITPALRAVRYLGDGWFGYLDAKYIFNYAHGGHMYINSELMPELKTTDYSEYSIGFEKSIDSFNLLVNFGRHDGGRSGWFGGTSLKYRF